MNYKTLLSIFFLLFLINCDQSVTKQSKNIEIEKKYKNSVFALVYNNELDNKKKVEKKSISNYNKYLKKK